MGACDVISALRDYAAPRRMDRPQQRCTLDQGARPCDATGAFARARRTRGLIQYRNPLYAARTVPRNFSTSRLSRWLSPESALADDSTWADAVPVSLAPRFTSVMLVATWVVPSAARLILRVISSV